MGRVSTKENKTVYQVCREGLGLSREKVADLISGVTPERIEKISIVDLIILLFKPNPYYP